jgi:hypothetical protein
MDDDVRRLHALVRERAISDPRLELLGAYLDGISEVATVARMAARQEDALASGYGGLGQFFDALVPPLADAGGDRILEFVNAIDLHYACDAFSASPMCLEGHYLEPYLNIVRAAGPGTQPPLTFNEPEALGEVLLGTRGMSVAEFATVFQGTAVSRMRELMQSLRWRDRPVDEVISEFNREVRHVNGSTAGASASILGTVGTTFLTGGIGFVASLVLTIARPALERLAPSFCDKVDGFVTGVSREGVLLAKVRRTLMGL